MTSASRSPRSPRRRSPGTARVAAGLACLALLGACGPGEQDAAAGDPSPMPTTPTPAGQQTEEPRQGEARPGDGGATPPMGPGEVLTPDAHGTAVRLSPGDEVSLQLPPPYQGSGPELDEPAVAELVPVEHLVDPGYDEFQVIGRAPGVAALQVRTPDGEQIRFDIVVE